MADGGGAQGPAGGPGHARSSFLRLFPSIMLPMFLALVDQTIVATAIPAIAGTLGDVERISWVVISYLIVATIAAPVYGRLGDMLGRRRLMIAGLAVFLAASLVCASATSLTMLIVGRVLQGCGGGGLMALAQALVGETVPPRDRARYQGYLAAVGVTSHTLGPVLGGFLTEQFGWRSIFLVNLPIGLAAVLLVLRLPPGGARSGERFRFDYLGVAAFAVSVASILMALQQAQRLRAENLALAAMLALLGLAALGLLIVTERRAPVPLLPVKLFRHPAIWRSDALAACFGALFLSLLTFVPLYFRVVHGTSAAETGLLLLPMTVGVGVGSLTTGRIVSRTGRTTLMPSVGLVVVTLALTFLALRSGELGTTEFAWLLGLNSLFMGTVMGVVQVVVQVAAGSTMLGAAAASVQLSRSLGAAIGTALVAAALFATLRAAGGEGAAFLGPLLQQGPAVLEALPAASRAAIQGEFVAAFRAALLTIAGFAAAGCVLAWSIPLRRI